ncbi:aminotransferase class IV [Nocardioides sp. GCM10027113]|uniref:aminotransferase class IV n=1 Tax=unclassified Nocardioides TaxID=2615069 RepID=UPI003614D898
MGPLIGSELHTLDGVLVETVPPAFALCPFGVFTTFVVIEGSALGLQYHLARLSHDARALWDQDLDEQHVLDMLALHVAHLGSASATVRVTLFPAEFEVVWPAGAAGCRILVSSRPATLPFQPLLDFSVGTAEFQRELPEVKSTSLVRQIQLRREAQLRGYDDVLFTRGDQVLEGATWAVVCWREGEVVTPRDGVLPSITARFLGGIAEEMGWIFHQRSVTVAELLGADLVQAVNANHPARAISVVDGIPLARDHSLLVDVAAAYSGLSRSTVTMPSGTKKRRADEA